MEFIIELIVEIFGEGIVCLLSNIMSNINFDSKSKKITKFVVFGIIYALAIALFVYSFITKSGRYTILVLIYFTLLVIAYLVRFLNKNIFENDTITKTVSVYLRIIHYAFPIILIFIACTYQNTASAFVIALSVVALFIYLCINLYQLNNKKKNHSITSFTKYLTRLLNILEKKENEDDKAKIDTLICKYPDYAKVYIKNLTDDDLKRILEDIVLNSIFIPTEIKQMFDK